MKIGVIGIGVVGSAISKSFQKRNIDVIEYDKYKNIGSISLMDGCNIVFLCLPTLYSDELKCYDKSSIYDVCDNLEKNNFSGIVVIKSTVEPETTLNLSKKYNLRFCHNPEFLTAKTAYEDFENQSHIVIGYIEKDTGLILEKFYKHHYPSANISLCFSTESEMMKIGVNCFYAVKIQYFNEIYELCQKHENTNYEIVRNLMLKNGWINPMHTNVPGTDGKLSYGGMCFPKDTNALLEHMKRMNSIHEVLGGTISERNKMR